MAADPANPLHRPVRLVLIADYFQEFFKKEAASGMLLMICTLLALVWANSPWAEGYHDLWHIHLSIHLGSWVLDQDLHHWINDGLMVLFFLLVGLEIKREIQVGELASPRQAALPIAAAIGGMVVPAGFYLLVNAGTEFRNGWGVPMATDIAFALGILSLLGPRVPLALKIFLTALAIVDDLGAVLVIAFFYTSDINWLMLGASGGCLGLLVLLNMLGIQRTIPYMVVGFFLWLTMLQSGIHATLAGVLLALSIPTRTKIEPVKFLEVVKHSIAEFTQSGIHGRLVLSDRAMQNAIHHVEVACAQVAPPLQRIEHALQPWVAFVIMPIFALANAGVTFGSNAGAYLTSPLSLGIIAGLFLGKPLGIALASFIVLRTGLAQMPRGVTWKQIWGVGCLGGVGFTMALFVAGLAFGKSETLDTAKIGVLAASGMSALLGAGLLIWCLKSTQFTEEAETAALLIAIPEGTEGGEPGDTQ